MPPDQKVRKAEDPTYLSINIGVGLNKLEFVAQCDQKIDWIFAQFLELQNTYIKPHLKP
jgi:hypothetical protein